MGTIDAHVDALEKSLLTAGLKSALRHVNTADPDTLAQLDRLADRWIVAGFTPLAARVWIESGVARPDTANALEELGVTPKGLAATLGPYQHLWTTKSETLRADDTSVPQITRDAIRVANEIALTHPDAIGPVRTHAASAGNPPRILDARRIEVYRSADIQLLFEVEGVMNRQFGARISAGEASRVIEQSTSQPYHDETWKTFPQVLAENIELADEQTHIAGDVAVTGYKFRNAALDKIANVAREAGNVSLRDYHRWRGVDGVVLDANTLELRRPQLLERISYDPEDRVVWPGAYGEPEAERLFAGLVREIQPHRHGVFVGIDSSYGPARFDIAAEVIVSGNMPRVGDTVALSFDKALHVAVTEVTPDVGTILAGGKISLPGYAIREGGTAGHKYSGRILAITPDAVYQEIGRGHVIGHDRIDLGSEKFGAIGDIVRIAYSPDQFATVEILDRAQREHEADVDRGL